MIDIIVGLVNYFFIIYVMPFIQSMVISLKPFYILTSIIPVIAYFSKSKHIQSNSRIKQKTMYAIMFGSILITLLSTLPNAGKGYDSLFFTYIIRTIPERGLNIIFQTDRPFYYLLTHMIQTLLELDPRNAVALSGVFSSILYVFSNYFLGKTLFDEETGSYNMLVASSMFLLPQLSVNFIGHLLGLGLGYLYVSFMVLFNRKNNIKYAIFSCLLFLALFYTHFSSAYFFGAIMGGLFLYNFHKDHSKKNYLMLMFTVAQGLVLLVLSTLSDSSNESFSLLSGTVQTGEVPFITYVTAMWDGLNYSYATEYVWIILFTLLGFYYILKHRGTQVKALFMGWGLLVFLLIFYARYYSARILLYYPFALLSGFFIKQNHRIIQVFICCLLFVVPVINFQYSGRYMMVRYFDDPRSYPWDTFQVEADQLNYIENNFDVEKTVIVCDVSFKENNRVELLAKIHPNLNPGIFYRLLSQVGNNLYLGNISSLVESGYYGYGLLEFGPFIGYEDNSISKHLDTKIILVPDQIYNIKPEDKPLLTPIYVNPSNNQTIYQLKVN